jgi:ankyrin repeat protein
LLTGADSDRASHKMYRKAKQEKEAMEAAIKKEQNTKPSCGCLKNKIDPKSLDEDGRNFLHIAVLQCGDNDCLVNHIIKEGCDVSARDKFGKTPLHYAVQKQYIGCVRRLLHNHSDVNILSKEGWSPLMIACKKGNLDIVELLVDSGAKLNLKNVRGEVAVHCAVSAGNTEILEYLLKKKANVNFTDEKGTTPLILASKCSNQDMMELILSFKPKVNQIDSFGRSALHYLIENGTGKKAISNIRALTAAGADVDVQDKAGDAPFVLAIKGNYPEALQCLVDARCDLTLVDGLNGTALVLAAMYGGNDVVDILLYAGEDADECGFAGVTPLCIASYSNKFELVKLLVEVGGANVNIPSRCGAAPINKCLFNVNHETAIKRHKCLAYLIRHGANVNYRVESVNYFTSITLGRNCVLSFAINSGYVSLVRMLLIAGAKVSAEESHHWKLQAETIFPHSIDSKMLIGEIIEWASQPRKLKDLCRFKIRKTVPLISVYSSINELPLPEQMKSFLNYGELDQFQPVTAIKSDKYDPVKGLLSPCALAMMGNGHPLDRAKIVIET